MLSCPLSEKDSKEMILDVLMTYLGHEGFLESYITEKEIIVSKSSIIALPRDIEITKEYAVEVVKRMGLDTKTLISYIDSAIALKEGDAITKSCLDTPPLK